MNYNIFLFGIITIMFTTILYNTAMAENEIPQWIKIDHPILSLLIQKTFPLYRDSYQYLIVETPKITAIFHIYKNAPKLHAFVETQYFIQTQIP